MSKDLAGAMADFLRLLAEEVERNRSLAKRLAVPFEEFLAEVKEKGVKSRKKAKAEVPEGFDPFKVYYDKGSVGLYEALASFDAATLKAILTSFALDPSRSYTRLRKPEKLRDLIVEKVKAMGERGEAFRDL
ncbi:hypothetical protein SAMN02745221_01665 [Thermosyntropha lipolytica DSM 11003]|uniref:Uncharacterized protein n=1 Tax=Thermosyntropha lipolytica DSM 11003 TaxID=1123382 RepID=A0A1M5Q6K3_9FIRM|nr:hypothetical protein [Thermosyntropha lipolytica]SHH09389.1 hypothetical protein SAMN02745221_01665 [Thermosyntropha lipolytica DSM 11003]